MSTITISNIRCYSFHGCLKEEAIIGAEYIVDISIETDTTEAERSDDLSKTVDYVDVFEIVKREMRVRSNLIEHVTKRIAETLLVEIIRIDEVRVCVTKIAPPLNGDVSQASVTVAQKRRGKQDISAP